MRLFTNKRVQLHNGQQITIRPIRSDDAHLLIDIFRHLSAESRYARFNEPLSHLTEEFLAENAARIAQESVELGKGWLALANLPGEPAVAVGGARYVRTGLDSAEVAITIRDDFQGQGLGKQLLAALLKTAQKDGLRTLTAAVMKSNTPALRLLRHVKHPVKQASDGSLTLITIDLTQTKRHAS